MKTTITGPIVIIILIVACFLQASTPVNQDKTRPIATYQVGSAKVIVWENNGKYGPWKNYEIEKIYLKEDKWLTSNSFNQSELLELKAAIDIAIEKEIAKIQNSDQGQK